MKIAIFDFDGTLVPLETGPFMAKVWKDYGYSRWKHTVVGMYIMSDYFIYKSGINKGFGKEEFRRNAMHNFLKLFKGMRKEEIDDFFDKASNEIMKNLNHEVVTKLRSLQDDGYDTVLLSGGYHPVIQRVGGNLGFNHIIASELEYDRDGFINYSGDFKINMGKNKVQSLKSFLEDREYELHNSIALADSHYDYHILDMVGEAIAVNPDDKLREIALNKKWEII